MIQLAQNVDDTDLEARANAAFEAGDWGQALSVVCARIANRALATFKEAGVRFKFGSQITDLPTAVVLGQMGDAARREAEARADTAERERLKAAADVLDAVGMLYMRLSEKPPEGDVSPNDGASRLAELILLGGLVAQTDVLLAGHVDGIWQDAMKRRTQREGRRASAANTAKVRTERWQPAALEKAKRACAQRPSIKSNDLATLIWEDATIDTPSYERVLSFVREKRKAGRLPPKRPAQQKV
ncbi:hypothetical protein [Phenylobacterium sp.]|uniref:hypothetical protein n=1 Tax=Phenylobacterium sp. TaxID=1871053 RepID=UPI0025D21F55|nr:hypothetical protein [Phenylobacterium sp.]